MHLVCSFILKVQVIQLFPISFVLPRFLPIYKLIPHSIQFFQNLSSQSFPNHHDHVTSNFHPCNPHLVKNFFYLLTIHNISNLQRSPSQISSSNPSSHNNFTRFQFSPWVQVTWQIFPLQRDKIGEDLLENALGGLPDLDDKEGSSAEFDEQLDPLSGWLPQLREGDQVNVAQDGAYDKEHHADGG